jgi:hypothetical protein
MIKKILTISFFTASLLLSGCGSDSEGEDRLETQQSLDKAEFSKVIANLENSASTDEEYLALAAAYMGRAGLSLADLITVVSDSADSESDSFGAFISSVSDATKDSKTPLLDLNKATLNYEKVTGVDGCNGDKVLSDLQKDICIFKGLAQTMGAATTISYITDDVGEVFNTDSESSDSKLDASTCAMQYALDGTVPEGCSIVENGNLEFASTNIYKDIDVTLDGEIESFEYLLTTATTISSTAITNGYCTTDSFETRVDEKPTTGAYHVCPITEDANTVEITTGSILADALNNGIDSIGVAADDDMKDDIDEFKTEVLDSSGKSSDETITEEDIVNYLNEQNTED